MSLFGTPEPFFPPASYCEHYSQLCLWILLLDINCVQIGLIWRPGDTGLFFLLFSHRGFTEVGHWCWRLGPVHTLQSIPKLLDGVEVRASKVLLHNKLGISFFFLRMLLWARGYHLAKTSNGLPKVMLQSCRHTLVLNITACSCIKFSVIESEIKRLCPALAKQP